MLIILLFFAGREAEEGRGERTSEKRKTGAEGKGAQGKGGEERKRTPGKREREAR